MNTKWLMRAIYFSNNWISRIGVIFASFAVVLWFYLAGSGARGGYQDLIQYLALPALFFLGLFLVPLGSRWNAGHNQTLPEKISFSDARVHQFLSLLAVATTINVVLGAVLSFQAVHYLESDSFCGTACHEPMRPEHVGHANAAHARVECVACHVRPGIQGFLSAKLNGTRQLAMMVTGGYSKPIYLPAAALKTASEACTRCHDTDREIGDKVISKFKYDDNGDRLDTLLTMHVGSGRTGKGIHGAHLAKNVAISYESGDEKREKILSFTLTRDGQSNTFQREERAQGKVKALFERKMDCLDCHNRPSHYFETKEVALDRAFDRGELNPKLPGLRKSALVVLDLPFATAKEADARIPSALAAEWKKIGGSGSEQELQKAGDALRVLYARNVFPEMKAGWGAYPDFRGHTQAPGCFRCHADELKDKAGKSLNQDCAACHQVAVVEEKAAPVVKDLGLSGAH